MPGGGLRLVGGFFIKWRFRGRFLKSPTPPTVDRRGVPVGLSILLLVVIVVIVILLWRKRSEVSTILIDGKIKNKIILILYIL